MTKQRKKIKNLKFNNAQSYVPRWTSTTDQLKQEAKALIQFKTTTKTKTPKRTARKGWKKGIWVCFLDFCFFNLVI
jgi:hypothetical protein